MQDTPPTWTRNLIFLALTVFFASLGQGFQSGVATNFFVHDLGLGGDKVLWLSGIREIPGLLLVFMAALLVRLPLSRRSALSIFLMAVGYGAFALVHSYAALIATSLIASVGFHNWMPMQSSLSMSLVPKSHCGRIMGRMSAVAALATLGGMLVVTLTVKPLGLRTFFILCGAALAIAAAMVWQVPTSVGKEEGDPQRLVFKRRYWLYYVLIFFEGSRTQVFFAFGSWVLARFYGMDAQRLSLLMIISGLVSFFGTPRLGSWIDRFGERRVLFGSYLALALSCAGYALLHNVWLLSALYVAINFLVHSRVGLETYINRIALSGDLVPSLAAGVSVNHITSVTMSLLAGTLLRVVGYEVLAWGAAVAILLSCPFALMMRTAREPACEVETAVMA